MVAPHNILITGAAGSIGAELTRQLAPNNSILALDIDETRLFDLVEELRQEGHDIKGRVVDIRDGVELRQDDFTKVGNVGLVGGGYAPDLIFHVAARKHVTPMEDTPLEAVSVNIQGTSNVIQFAKKYGARLVNISTDKVVNAECVMGATKKVAEIMVRNAGFISVRFGNVLGSRGSVIPIWQRQMDQGKPLTITDERMERYMMSIEEACALVIKASEIGEPGQILILDMGTPVNILRAAKDILGKVGKSDYPIKTIGIRPGEVLSEELMTASEQIRAKKVDDFWIISNAKV